MFGRNSILLCLAKILMYNFEMCEALEHVLVHSNATIYLELF